MPICLFDPRDIKQFYLAATNFSYHKKGNEVAKLHFHTHRVASLQIDYSDLKNHPDTLHFSKYLYQNIQGGLERPPHHCTFAHAHFQLKYTLENFKNPVTVLLDLIHAMERINFMSSSLRIQVPTLKAVVYMLIDLNRKSIEATSKVMEIPFVQRFISFERGVFKLRATAFSEELIDPFVPFLADSFLLAQDVPLEEGERLRMPYFIEDAGKKLEAKIEKSIGQWLKENRNPNPPPKPPKDILEPTSNTKVTEATDGGFPDNISYLRYYTEAIDGWFHRNPKPKYNDEPEEMVYDLTPPHKFIKKAHNPKDGLGEFPKKTHLVTEIKPESESRLQLIFQRMKLKPLTKEATDGVWAVPSDKPVKWGEGKAFKDLVTLYELKTGRSVKDWWDSYLPIDQQLKHMAPPKPPRYLGNAAQQPYRELTDSPEPPRKLPPVQLHSKTTHTSVDDILGLGKTPE